ncbi:NAD(P)/FAD-dependent oxidoreductase [Candidatus Woesearchaeota archaeon]|nr:NAD(P)/FAD-dependent oxidoreductase [Candidatus Woesearchaeota archaeon]
MQCDVVIIGAGPAGLMAARTLAKTNIKFIVIDQKKQIGLPLKCGEGIRKDGFLELFKTTNYPFVKNRTNKFEIWAGKTKQILDIDYLILDRPKFEKWLAFPTKNKIKLNTTCRDITKKQDCLEIITNKGTIKANLAILANGCNYKIQKKFNLIKSPPVTIPCYGGIFTNHNLNPKTLYFFFNDNDPTALWIFPKNKNKANIGIGIFPSNRKTTIKMAFKQAIKKHAPKSKGKPSYAGIFPTTGQIKQTYAERLLVCGNAAGQVYAGAGEGIYFALKSGQLAAKTATKAIKKRNFKAPFLKQYEKAWKKSFGNQLKASLVFTSILLFGFQHKNLEKLFKLPKEKELINLFMHGKIPIKARLASILVKSPPLLKLFRKFYNPFR